ncbi:hypothetical protein GHT06_009276 [Daphnia sinensis]|uniref:Major facilitator superfamily domain-containing protein 12-like n=1 Tax=Daphnia sinensis TaxID=1820382 RepID=A0AAD5Q2Y9_9CRUS|nr:hypothetical protein GHT06_009276 [Daphnia sinensis]
MGFGGGSISWGQKLSFGTGHVLNDLCASVWFSYLLVYLQYVLLIPSGLSGIILLIGQIADAVATPLVGILSDHGQCCCIGGQRLCNYGKRKIWHLIGSICVIVSFPLMFVGCMGLCEHSNGIGYLIILIALVCLFQFGWAAAQISHLAMIPELTHVEAERDELNIIRFSFDIITDILVYAIALIIFSQSSHNLSQVTAESGIDFMILALSITGIGIIFTVIFHVGVDEKPIKIERPASIIGTAAVSLKTQWLGWFYNWHFYRVGILYTAARLAHNTSIVFVPLYLQETQQSAEMLALIPLVMNIAGLLGSGLLKITIKLYGKKASYAMASLMGLISCIWLVIDTNLSENAATLDPLLGPPSSDNAQFYLLASMMGGGAAMVVILSLTSAADLIDSNTETSAFVYGCMSFCDKMSSGIVVAVIQGLHSWVCQEGCTYFYAQVLIYGVGIPFVFVIITSLLGPKTQSEQQEARTVKNYGTCRTEEATSLIEYVH